MKLIDADAAIESLTEYGNGRAVYIGVEEAVRRIEQLPPVQPEHKTGSWIPVTNGRGGHQCDRCGCYAPSYQSGTEWLSNFCPECNADMRGEANGQK